MNDSDSLGLSILVACFALLVAVTCAAAGWRLAGNGPILDPSPPPTTWYSGPGDVVEVTP